MATRTSKKSRKTVETPKTPKTPKTSTQASEVVVEGLAEAVEEARKAELMAQIVKARKAQAQTNRDIRRAEKQRKARLAKLTALSQGIVDADHNPNGRHNPQIFPETLRAANPGEEINGKPAKGWVVTIRCAECGNDRLINTQDAFQVRFCGTKCAKANKKGTAVKAELDGLSVEELEARLAEIKTAAA